MLETTQQFFKSTLQKSYLQPKISFLKIVTIIPLNLLHHHFQWLVFPKLGLNWVPNIYRSSFERFSVAECSVKRLPIMWVNLELELLSLVDPQSVYYVYVDQSSTKLYYAASSAQLTIDCQVNNFPNILQALIFYNFLQRTPI